MERKIDSTYPWVVFLFALFGTIIFYFVSGYVIHENGLKEVDNLVLTKRPESSGRRVRSLEFEFSNMGSTYYLANEAYRCSEINEILSSFNIGDTLAIKYLPDHDESKAIYSLVRNGKEYVDLECINNEAGGDNWAGFIASLVSTFLSLIILILHYKIRLKGDWYYSFNPAIIVVAVWVILFLILR